MTIQLRAPLPDEGAEMWELVRDSGALDLNSSYAYLMLARNFTDTSVVAVDDDEVVGFVAGYRVPDDPSALFVWQVGVAEEARGRGVATRMLDWLVETGDGLTHIEATVGPDNTASQNLFTSVARSHDAQVEVTEWLDRDDFPEDGHDPEHLFRIGPLAHDTGTDVADLDRARGDAPADRPLATPA